MSAPAITGTRLRHGGASRRSGPLAEFPAFPTEAADLRRRRTRIMADLRKLEWTFELHPSPTLALACAALRERLNELEAQIAVLCEALS